MRIGVTRGAPSARPRSTKRWRWPPSSDAWWTCPNARSAPSNVSTVRRSYARWPRPRRITDGVVAAVPARKRQACGQPHVVKPARSRLASADASSVRPSQAPQWQRFARAHPRPPQTHDARGAVARSRRVLPGAPRVWGRPRSGELGEARRQRADRPLPRAHHRGRNRPRPAGLHRLPDARRGYRAGHSGSRGPL